MLLNIQSKATSRKPSRWLWITKSVSSRLDQSLVDKLKHLMLVAEKLLADAEQKQITDTAVKLWLNDLKHLFYRAEEIANEITTEALRSSMDLPPEPESFGTKLRYLDVSETGIKELPESLSTLCNLQSLLMSGCNNLERLPADMSRLVSLRHLDINKTTSLHQMPKHMSKLNCLQTLSGFVVSKHCGQGIEQLRDLQHIRGQLALRRLQNVSSPSDALDANLSCREHIKELALEFDDKENDDSQKGRAVLENLKPHANLESLTIINYPGTRFPSWLDTQWSIYENILSLFLNGCKYCCSLPPLGQLPSLRYLDIVGMDYITAIGSEFYACSSGLMTWFPVLRTLVLKEMKHWKDWLAHEIECSLPFPFLRRLSLVNCPELEGHLPVNVCLLDSLRIDGCENLDKSLLQPPSMRCSPLLASHHMLASHHRAWGNLFHLASITFLRLTGAIGELTA